MVQGYNSGKINKLQCREATIRNGNKERQVYECELINTNPDISNATEHRRTVTDIEEIEVSPNVSANLKTNIVEGSAHLESEEQLYAEVRPNHIEIRPEK